MATMSNVLSNEEMSPRTGLGDVLLQPLKWCGHQWTQLIQIEEGSNFYKTCKILQKIIPFILLSLATILSSSIGLLGSIIQSFNNASQNFSIEMTSEISAKCKKLGITHQSNVKLTEQLLSHLQFPANSIEIRDSECPFDEKTHQTKVINLTLPKRFGFVDIFMKSLQNKPCLENIGDLLLKSLLDLPLSKEDLQALTQEVRYFKNLHIHISKDLKHAQLIGECNQI